MLFGNVVIEVLQVLLQFLSVDVANVTEIFLVVVEFICSFAEFSEGIQHETRDNVAEKKTEENSIDHVITETDYFKLFHCF